MHSITHWPLGSEPVPRAVGERWPARHSKAQWTAAVLSTHVHSGAGEQLTSLGTEQRERRAGPIPSRETVPWRGAELANAGGRSPSPSAPPGSCAVAWRPRVRTSPLLPHAMSVHRSGPWNKKR